MSDLVVSGGSPEPLGVTEQGAGINVAVFSANASAIEFCLFDRDGERELLRMNLPERTGDVFHGQIDGIGKGARYGLRAHGRFAPAEGFRFNPSKLLMDPYALAIDRPFQLHPSMFGSRRGDREPDDQDSAAWMPKAIVSRAGAARPGKSLIAWPQTVLYELHVRGFTMRREEIPEPLRGTFGGLGHPVSIEHLVRLGVTSVEIMPAAAWIEERHLSALGMSNYWGYNPVAFMAPDPRLAPGGWAEIRDAVSALAEAGIETILDVVFNHTGEGDALGPTVSLRGLDNSSYYRLIPGDLAAYNNDTGCGNALALERPAMLRLVMDSLRAWALIGGVHGFRFDLATTLGRRAEGFDPAAPLLAAITQDPVLRETKLIAEPWDIGPGGYRAGAFSPEWGEWNDRFRDGARRFWRGDPGVVGDFATRLSGSADLFWGKRRPSRSVNFVVAHDGFTLADLVSYERKHNEANGEANHDGTDANASWNHGVEGPTADPAVRAARWADQRALLASLLLARGTPMLAMGAELGQSQGGNNNAYAQDNPTTWIDWSMANKALFDWTARLIALRREHPALSDDSFLTGRPVEACLLPDVEWLRPDGQAMTADDWRTPPEDSLIMALCGRDQPNDPASEAHRIILVFNRAPKQLEIILPEPMEGRGWQILADSTLPDVPGGAIGKRIILGARGVLVLGEAPLAAGLPGVAARNGRGRAPGLEHLARAAGVAGEWWSVDGTRHTAGDDTRRAVLAAMGLPAANGREALQTLGRLADERNRRPLPNAFTAWSGETAFLEVPLERGLTRRPFWLSVALGGDGSGEPMRVRAQEGETAPAVAIDGREYQAWRIPLPELPVGRHRIYREDAPDISCRLTVAPSRCHLPAGIAQGGKFFGVAAQLYSLRRKGDQGIGDLTTLAELAEQAARRGAATVGINPLHAMFSTERERASPYQPSDRRFLDPIYLDVGRLGEWPDAAGADAELASRAGAAASLSEADSVDYSGVWALKRAVLERRFAGFEAKVRMQPDSQAARAFAGFVAAGGAALQRFATFEAIAETRPGQYWRRWAMGLADAAGPEVEAFAEAHPARVRFHQYLQYLALEQLADAAARGASAGLGFGFLRDLAVGAAPDGAETWAEPALFAAGVSIGAPPDPLAPSGQVWGLPAPNPLEMARTGCAQFGELLAANMRHAGGLRIDHVMGLSRLFWVPEGAEGADGTYVSYPFRDLAGQVALESTRARCLVVGEDLGTVPDGLRAELAEANILSYRVLLLEREGRRFRPPSAYPERAVACVSTHDLPTFAGWWRGADIAERRALGLLAAQDATAALADRAAEKSALADALTAEGLAAPGDAAPGDAASDQSGPSEALVADVHDFVGHAPATLLLVQADDLAGAAIGVNLPGTDIERPNWRRKLAPEVADLLRAPAAQAVLDRLQNSRAPKPPNPNPTSLRRWPSGL